ncbi:hypothetical protein RRG08_012652 [Elysia crispata]|uniref:Uncharacterized protein n=1 Tax=Elysia crispata TaxID=231223 RepID=A0AAE1D1G7_9GAST|nr:hypothetical protein RRG08_012652 [Elysia crispata]
MCRPRSKRFEQSAGGSSRRNSFQGEAREDKTCFVLQDMSRKVRCSHVFRRSYEFQNKSANKNTQEMRKQNARNLKKTSTNPRCTDECHIFIEVHTASYRPRDS